MKKNKLRWIAIAAITTIILIIIGQPSTMINPSLSGVKIGLPTQAQQATPTPKPTPTPAASPAPQPSPSPQPTPTPPPTPQVEPLPLSNNNYKDPQGRFQVGILDGYNVGFVGNFPLIESPEGNLAYTVVVKPRESSRQIPNASLAQIAIETFERGEGFTPGSYQELGTASVRVPWTGTVRIGSKVQPIQGSILARQINNNIFLLLVSATEEKTSEIDAAIAALSDNLKPIEPSSTQPES
ncbi:hypothetical protein ACL6C3_28745 [Capilliphycus salinus ALCB114379]|uniref:hypothetical protein n=1 Tax=Capilliphycus salinus TaxID=2768948 RepID=UPI0039A6FE47